MRGNVKFYNADRGFGFIIQPDGKDVFFHVSNLRSASQPCEGDEVEFDIVQGNRGPEAHNVVVTGYIVEVESLQLVSLQANYDSDGFGFDLRDRGGQLVEVPQHVIEVIAPVGDLLLPVKQVGAPELTDWLIALGGRVRA